VKETSHSEDGRDPYWHVVTDLIEGEKTGRRPGVIDGDPSQGEAMS